MGIIYRRRTLDIERWYLINKTLYFQMLNADYLSVKQLKTRHKISLASCCVRDIHPRHHCQTRIVARSILIKSPQHKNNFARMAHVEQIIITTHDWGLSQTKANYGHETLTDCDKIKVKKMNRRKSNINAVSQEPSRFLNTKKTRK